MNSEKYYNLRKFLDAYFHQDWLEEFDNANEVIEAAIAEQPDTARREAHSELIQLIHDLGDREVVHTMLLDEFGWNYDPEADGLTIPDWLRLLSKKLAEE